jgi:hypothetical protein
MTWRQAESDTGGNSIHRCHRLCDATKSHAHMSTVLIKECLEHQFHVVLSRVLSRDVLDI